MEVALALVLQALFQYPYQLVLVFLFSILLYFICSFKSGHVKSNLPPSPPRLPIIGNLHQLGSLPHHSLKALSEKYGPLMLLQLGSQAPTIVVSSADVCQEIIRTHDIVFSDRPKATGSDILFYRGKDVAFSSYGEYWKQARKMCVLELLSLKRVQELQFVRHEEVTDLVNMIRSKVTSFVGSDNCVINMSQMFSATSNNIMSRCILGHKSMLREDGSSKFGELAKKLEIQITAFCVGDFFPCLSWVDVLSGFIGELKETFQAFDEHFDKVIKEHRRLRADGESTDARDFVSILLQLQKDGISDFEFTDFNLKAILLDMFVGGSDTTLTSLEWLMAELIRNPRVMKKAQEEVRRVVGKKAKIEMNDLTKMDYVKCVIKENLRLHPSAPLLVPRETSRSIEIGGYDIPAKTRVIINAWAIHRDPKLWDRPEEFFPERFENNPIDFKGKDFQFIPFGAGRRGCPGLTFGVASIEYVIANLLYWFDWKLPGDEATLGDHIKEDFDMTEIYGLTVHKKIPLHLVPLPYSPA